MKRSTQIRVVILVAVLAAFASVAWGQGAPSSTPTDPDPGSAASLPARTFRPSDVWAPPSFWHVGPLSLNSAEISGGFSSEPVLGGGQFSNITDLSNYANRGAVGFMRASTNFGLSHRWKWGVFDLSYMPTFSRESTTELNQVTHDLTVRFSRAIGHWDLTLIGNGGTYDQFSTMFQTQSIQPVIQMQTPLANTDMLSLISLPPALTMPKMDMLLVGRTLFRGNAGATVSRKLSERTRVTFSGFYNISRPMAAENIGVDLMTASERMSSRSFSAGIERNFSIRYRLGVTYSDQATDSLIGGLYTQRAVQLTLGWLPTPKWSLFAAAGPALRTIPLPSGELNSPRQISSSWNLQVARSLTSSAVSLTYAQDLDMIAAIPGAAQSRRVNFTVMRKPRANYRWTYSVSGGYQWVQGTTQLGSVVQGWIFQPMLSFPINRSLEFFTQYVYFSQDWQPLVASAGTPNAFRRQMALWGLRWRLTHPPESAALSHN